MQLYRAIKYLYPHAEPGKDFVLRDDADGRGPYIEQWNLPSPQPTEEELRAAWEEVSTLPPEPEPETPEQKIARLEAELAAAREERLAAMEAIAELYEALLRSGTL